MSMRRIAHLFILSLLLVTAFASRGVAQTQTGTVEGKVLDEQGAVLPGATLTLTGPTGSQTTVSDSLGVYRFVGVAPGTYVLKTELQGFLAQQVEQVVVPLGKTATVDFSLKVGGLTENIEVRALGVDGGRQELVDRDESDRRAPGEDADLLGDVDGPAEQRTGHQQQLGVRRAGRATATRCCSTAWTRAIPKAGRPGRSSTRT